VKLKTTARALALEMRCQMTELLLIPVVSFAAHDILTTVTRNELAVD
jgi:hypothetical protein